MLPGILTEATCGEACWQAREDVCRCSCNGKNHACLRGQDRRPERTRKLNGHLYQLVAVSAYREGSCLAEIEEPIDKTKAAFLVKVFAAGLWERYKYDSTPGYPAKVKTASESEVARWPEFAGWRTVKGWRPVGLWVRCDMAHLISS